MAPHRFFASVIALLSLGALQDTQASWYIENGFDFVDNDIGNVPAPDSSMCNAKCVVAPGCGAWSWSSHNGGTCWLKSTRGAVVVNANVKSALRVNPLLNVCKLDFNFNYVDNDLASVGSSNAAGCCDLCEVYPGCRAFSWSVIGGVGTCWLKSFKGNRVFSPGVTSAEVYPISNPPLCLFPPIYNFDYVDNDIGNQKSASPDGCCPICKNTAGCHAYSWSNYQGGTCWLKNFAGATTFKPGVISGVI